MPILNLWQLVYIFAIGLVLALQEIEIEGTAGWAKNLPTKRLKFWWTQKSGKEITGYHAALTFLLLLFFHLPLVFFNSFSWGLELLILTQYFFFVVYWDFLWFVLNPGFRLKNFKKGNIDWHTSWFLGMPSEYWLGLLAGLLAPVIFYGWPAVIGQLYYLIIYAGLTLLTVIIFYLFFKEKL